MENSVIHLNNDIYKITIISTTEEEAKLLDSSISKIKERVFEYFDQAVKERLGEDASIASVVDDSGLPYEIHALISIK